MSVQIYPSLESLPERVVAFVGEAERRSFFHGIPWYRALYATACPDGDEPRIYVAEREGRPIATLIARERWRAGTFRTHMLLSVSHIMYTWDYGPILDAGEGLAGLSEIVDAIAAASPAFDVLRFDSMDPYSPGFTAMVAGFRSQGFLVQPFKNFGNWFDNVEGQSSDAYLANRSSQTRYAIGRRIRSLARSGRGRYELVTGGPKLEQAVADYERVAVQSWKDEEPCPGCVPAVVHMAAKAGALRLGIYYIDNEPAAAQIWIVHGGRATIFRLSYAEKFGKLSVATALTWEIMRHVLDFDKPREIDFARGDDEYKKKWLPQRREKWGMLVFNPHTAKGLVIAAKNLIGHRVMMILRRWPSL
ncbi:MAG: GNAT family N-acetyltransferase [Alphaproteobacteria bacterium]